MYVTQIQCLLFFNLDEISIKSDLDLQASGNKFIKFSIRYLNNISPNICTLRCLPLDISHSHTHTHARTHAHTHTHTHTKMAFTKEIHTEIVEAMRANNFSKEDWKEIKNQKRNLENAHLV